MGTDEARRQRGPSHSRCAPVPSPENTALTARAVAATREPALVSPHATRGYDLDRAEEAVRPSTSPARLAELSCADNPFVASHALRNSSTPTSTFTTAADVSAAAVHSHLTGRRDGWREAVVNELSRTGAAARHPACPADRLAALAVAVHATIDALGDADGGWSAKMAPVVLVTIMQNPSCPQVTVVRAARRLADSQWLYLRVAAASHPSCPPDVLERLADDPERDIRLAVAAHPAAPTWIRSYALL